jgi:predicted nucleic-acid-binding protein
MKGVDTNVLMRYLTRDDAKLSPVAAKFIKGSCTKQDPCLLNSVVLCELVWVLESAYGYPRDLVADAVQRILETSGFKVEAPTDSWRALEAYQSGIADFADALIGVLNQSGGCETTVTLDKKAARLATFSALVPTDQ